MTHERSDGNTIDKDEARTPPILFKKLDERFHFHADVCASNTNHLCDLYWTKETNSLVQEWHKLPGMNTKPIIFCQPPYSNPAPFIQKSAEESRNGATCVMLIPADTACKAFHKYIIGVEIATDGTTTPNEFGASEIIFLKPRVTFNNPDGTKMKGSPKFGSMVVVFDKSTFTGKPVISSMGWK
jgi:phage N-6-adenine-methyltransferase